MNLLHAVAPAVPPSVFPSAKRRGSIALALAASGVLVACGGGGGGGDGSGGGGGAGGVAEHDAYFASLAGTWTMTGTERVTIGNLPIPVGLESGAVTLDVFRVEPIEGSAGEHACVYKLTLPGADLTSPSFGPRLSAVGAAVHPQPMGEPFWLGGLLYRPVDDVTIEFGIVFESAPRSGDAVTGFTARYEFQIYAGHQLESVEVDEPGVDDDGDGLIDEPGEYVLEDQVAPDAFLLDAGQITVEFARSGGA